MNIRTKIALLSLAVSLALAACGNKGPLVLPDPQDAEAVQDDEADEGDASEDAGDDVPAGDAGR